MKILILEKFVQPSTDRYQIEGEILGHTVVTAHYRDLIIHIDSQIEILVKNMPLTDFDRIYLRSLQGFEEMATLVAKFAKLKQIPLFDQMLMNNLSWIDSKSYELFQLCQAGLPVIPSIIGLGSIVVQESQSYPLIIKRGTINQGKGVFKCPTRASALAVAQKYESEVLIAEPFISNQGDLRIIVIGNKAVGAMHRLSSDTTEFRNNVSLGAQVKTYQLDAQQTQLAVTAAQAVGYDVAGVDLIFDQERQKWLVMEVNRSPQYRGFETSTGHNVIKEIMEFLVQPSH